MATTTAPPTPQSLEIAAARLGPALRPEMYLHLALPTSDAIGLQVRRGARGWRWRGVSVNSLTPDAACQLAALGYRDGDVYLDLEAPDPAAWVKPIRSGSRVILFGMDVLFASPLLLLLPEMEGLAVDAVNDCRSGALAPGVPWNGLPVRTSPLGWLLG